jgi:hypothetical protein
VAIVSHGTGRGYILAEPGCKYGHTDVKRSLVYRIIRIIVNSLTAMDGHDRPLFNELRARVVSL